MPETYNIHAYLSPDATPDEVVDHSVDLSPVLIAHRCLGLGEVAGQRFHTKTLKLYVSIYKLT